MVNDGGFGDGGIADARYYSFLWINMLDITATYKPFIVGGTTSVKASIKLSGSTVSWYSGSAYNQRNESGKECYYVAFG